MNEERGGATGCDIDAGNPVRVYSGDEDSGESQGLTRLAKKSLIYDFKIELSWSKTL